MIKSLWFPWNKRDIIIHLKQVRIPVHTYESQIFVNIYIIKRCNGLKQ